MTHTAPAAFAPLVRDSDFIEGVMGRRCVAWLMDLIFLVMIFIPIFLILIMFGLLTLGFGFAMMSWLPAIPFLYHYLSLLRRGSATPGQAIMGLTVRRDADLGPPDPLQALIFTFLFYVTMATSGFLLLIALFTQRHRTLHDLASGLVVVRRRALDAWTG